MVSPKGESGGGVPLEGTLPEARGNVGKWESNLSHRSGISHGMAARYTRHMTKRLVDIDDALLSKAQELLEAETMKETVNLALTEVINLDRRRRLLDRMRTGNGVDLDETTMGEAWS